MFNFSINKKKKNLSKMIIVSVGGGTGQFSLLSGLKEIVPNKNIIKAIVTTLDNGGSSGKLITQYGVLPPGDIRNCIVALSEEIEILNRLFQYRFDNNLQEHNFGNLMLTALTDLAGNFEDAVKITSKILRIKGEVIPVTLEKNDIIAKLENGSEIFGETLIDTTQDKKIKSVKLHKKANANPRAVEILKKADVIIFGPGDLYTSIIPNILFPEIANAITQNKKAKKILITNIMTKPGETDDFRVSDFKNEIEKYLNSNINFILSNVHIPASAALKNYYSERKFPIPIDEDNIKNSKLIKADLIDENEIVRHCPKKLAKKLKEIIGN